MEISRRMGQHLVGQSTIRYQLLRAIERVERAADTCQNKRFLPKYALVFRQMWDHKRQFHTFYDRRAAWFHPQVIV